MEIIFIDFSLALRSHDQFVLNLRNCRLVLSSHCLTLQVGPEEQSELDSLASQPECGKGNKRQKPLSKGDWKKALARRRGEHKYLQLIAEKNKV